ncbi:MAG: ATP-binding cassette domain-containing protein [Candidatus Dadabacteria bacterium]|nr:ATP-binding cassette domain-containing protein [Candidatus Dadabacteria bacterium]
MNKTKIELYNVGKTKNRIKILKDINLRFGSGKIHILIGPSGAGKTTLLRLLNRMDEPSSGKIEYDGKDIKDIPVLELRRRIGMVFQIPVIFDGTVKNNLSVPYSLRTNSNHVNEEDLINALELSGLRNDFLERRASDLSVGEKQRLTVARALMNKPDVLLLDEPTSALDHFTGIKLLESIKKLNEALGLTIIMVTHQLEYARILDGRVINLVNGTIVRVEEVEDSFLDSESI